MLHILFYNYFFSKNGYLEYKNEVAKKIEIELDIKKLKEKIKTYEEKIGILKNDQTALENFTREFLLYDENVQIWKFIEEGESQELEQKLLYDINFYRKIYIISGSILIVLFTLIFYKLSLAREDENKSDL
ncbi:MAG: hypothetical protein OEZ22_02600 [Spirochaetia bacterium]|nr:hypothetical protein [Spirochaetia bacterium]